jgi:hypothetical protein
MTNERERAKNFAPPVVSAAAVFVYLVLLWFISKPFSGWLSLGSADEQGLLSALRHDSGNAAYPYLLGRHYQTDLKARDTSKAIAYYRASIKRSPLQAGSWLALSKAYREDGQAAASDRSFERAVKLSPNDPDLMWEAGIFWLMNNKTDAAVEAMKRFLLLEPSRQDDVCDLCWKLQLGNSRILQDLLPASYEYRSRYLSYLIGTGRSAEAQEAWKTLDNTRLEKDLFINYVNFLISEGLYDEAWAVWKEITDKIEGLGEQDETTLVWDPGFEQEILNGGFDWTIRETEGVNVFLDDSVRMSGNRSLGVSFDGLHNPDLTLAQQVVRVKPGSKYRLRGYVRTESITTTNGIFLNVLGDKCSGLSKKSEVLTGTGFWKEIDIDFDTPADCRAIRIAVRREKSNKLDNKIEGTAWIDGITLRPQGILQTSSFARH